MVTETEGAPYAGGAPSGTLEDASTSPSVIVRLSRWWFSTPPSASTDAGIGSAGAARCTAVRCVSRPVQPVVGSGSSTHASPVAPQPTSVELSVTSTKTPTLEGTKRRLISRIDWQLTRAGATPSDADPFFHHWMLASGVCYSRASVRKSSEARARAKRTRAPGG